MEDRQRALACNLASQCNRSIAAVPMAGARTMIVLFRRSMLPTAQAFPWRHLSRLTRLQPCKRRIRFPRAWSCKPAARRGRWSPPISRGLIVTQAPTVARTARRRDQIGKHRTAAAASSRDSEREHKHGDRGETNARIRCITVASEGNRSDGGAQRRVMQWNWKR